MRFRNYHAGRLEDDEARELARDARRGDAKARERLILLGAVVVHHRDMIGRYRRLGRWMTIEDAAQEGWVAMCEAVDRYDPDRPTSLLTFAWKRVEHRLGHLLAWHRAKKRGCTADHGEAGGPLEELPDRGPHPWHATDVEIDAAALFGRAVGREKVVIGLHYGLHGPVEHGMTAIGAALGVSRTMAWRIQGQAFRRIRAGA